VPNWIKPKATVQNFVAVTLAGATAMLGWALADGDLASAAAALVALTSGLAVIAALRIATQDRQRTDAALETQRSAEHEARREERETYARRRDYEEAVRLVTLIEQDRQKYSRNATTPPPRSAEAAGLVNALWYKRNQWGSVWDYYVEALRDPTNRYASGEPPFQTMQEEVRAAIDRLSFLDRKPDTDTAS